MPADNPSQPPVDQARPPQPTSVDAKRTGKPSEAQPPAPSTGEMRKAYLDSQKPGSVESGRAASVGERREQGLAAARGLKEQFESKGHGINQEVTIKGGAGGSRVDLAPKPDAPQTIPKTVESKYMDLANYRLPNGELDTDKIRSVMNEDLGQVMKHEKALEKGVKPDLPKREAIVYTVEHGDNERGEVQKVQQVFDEAAKQRGSVEGRKFSGGVLQLEEGVLKTASGVPLRGVEVRPTERPSGGNAMMMLINPEFVDEFLGAATGTNLEARAKHSDVFHMTSQQREQLRQERFQKAQDTEFHNAVKVEMVGHGLSEADAEKRVREHRDQVNKETKELQKQNPGTMYITESTYVPPPTTWLDRARTWLSGK